MTQSTERDTVRETIKQHLLRVGSITGMEAAGLYKCRHLPSRIFELKSTGMPITSVHKKDATGQRYVRYTLIAEGTRI